jgi:pimeloyl-ACP methyl ester carboxylesterase
MLRAGTGSGVVEGVAFEQVGEGEPLLLLHGTGGTRGHWKPLVPMLAKERTLILVDLPEHGESEPPPRGTPHTPIGYAEVLAVFLDRLGIDRVHVAGNSVGGWTALEVAKLGRARSVAAISPAGLWPREDPLRSVFQIWSQHKMGQVFAPLTPPLMRRDLGRSVLLRGTIAQPRKMPAEDAVVMAQEFAHTPGFKRHLAETRRERFRGGTGIDVPVTIAWGDKDSLLPRSARREDELPPRTQVVVLPNCGHIPMWDEPELVARTILGAAAVPA